MVETISRLNVFTRELQDLCNHNSEFESVEVAFKKKKRGLSEVSGSGSCEHRCAVLDVAT